MLAVKHRPQCIETSLSSWPRAGPLRRSQHGKPFGSTPYLGFYESLPKVRMKVGRLWGKKTRPSMGRMDFTGKCFGLGGSGGVCCMFSLILGLGTLVLQAKQGNGFSPLTCRCSSPPPTSSGWCRALGHGETTAVVQHHEQGSTSPSACESI